MSPFGELAILPDGRFVTTPWLQPGCYVGDTFWPGPVLLQPDACVTSDGHVWVVAKGHDDLNLYVKRDDWEDWLAVGQPVGSRAIIAPNQTRPWVYCAFADEAFGWIENAIHGDRTIVPTDSGLIDDGSGGNGMRDWQGNPVPLSARPMTPLDAPLKGYLCRRAIKYGNTTIALALFDPPQVVIARGDQIGTLALGGADFIRMSQDGKYWAGTRYMGDVNLGGLIPDMIPPLMVGPVMPDVSLVTPARSDFRLGAQMFNNAPGIEPNPHVPFGSFTVPIRLSTLPTGDIINAGQDDGHPISFYAGEDGSQTFAQAVALQRPKADAAGVGLSLYVDRVPFTPEDLAFYRPGDVLMPQVNAIAAIEPAEALIAAGYPVCLSLGLQRQAPDVCASLIIDASTVACFGACIFAKDRSDVPWAAIQPYLDRWNSTITAPADWPKPTQESLKMKTIQLVTSAPAVGIPARVLYFDQGVSDKGQLKQGPIANLSTAWTPINTYGLDGKWDNGQRVILESGAAPGMYLGETFKAAADAAVFTVHLVPDRGASSLELPGRGYLTAYPDGHFDFTPTISEYTLLLTKDAAGKDLAVPFR